MSKFLNQLLLDQISQHSCTSPSPSHHFTVLSTISQIYLKKVSEFTDHDRLKKIISGLEIFRWLSEGNGGYCSDPDKISWVPWVAAWKRAGRLLLNLHLKSWPPAQYCSELGNCFNTWTLAEREYCRETIWVLIENLSTSSILLKYFKPNQSQPFNPGEGTQTSCPRNAWVASPLRRSNPD